MQTIPYRQDTDYAQDTGYEMVTCVENSIFRPVPEADAGFGPALTARRVRSGSFSQPRNRVALPTVSRCGARTSSFVPEGTRSTGSINPPLATVGYDRASLRDRRSSANGGADICIRAEDTGREIPELRGGFVLHDADDEWVMRLDCPEFEQGKAEC